MARREAHLPRLHAGREGGPPAGAGLVWSDELMPRLLKRPMLLLTSGKIIGRVPSEDVAHGTHLDRHQHRRRDLTRRQVGERHQLHRLKAVVLESSSGGRRRRWAQAAMGLGLGGGSSRCGRGGVGSMHLCWRSGSQKVRRQHVLVLTFRISRRQHASVLTFGTVQDLRRCAARTAGTHGASQNSCIRQWKERYGKAGGVLSTSV